MKKMMLITMAVIILTVTVCACTKNETPAATPPSDTQTSAPTQEPSPEPSPSDDPETQAPQSTEDKDMILDFLDGGQRVFGEDTDEMDANQGSSFGEIEKKQMGDGGYEFTFEPNINEHMPLITRLDEFEGAGPLAGQAVYIRFKTSTTGIYFSFLGDNDFGVYFGSEGEPLVFTYTENAPFGFEGDLKLTEDKWYNMIMAMAPDGTFNCVIYLDDEYDNPTAATVALGETQSAQGYKDQSWQFEIATHEVGTVTIERYAVYTYTAFATD